MSKEGWIKLFRKIQECILWMDDEPFCKRAAWIDLLLDANHRDTELLFDGKMITVTRGQLITSVRKLAKRWGWGNQKTLKFLRLLEELGMIKKDSDAHRTLITIENYEVYQGDENTNGTLIDTHPERKSTTNKKEKNEKNINKSIGELTMINHADLSTPVRFAVEDWVKYKKERREGYKETGLKTLLTQISNKEKEFGAEAVANVIYLSMSNGWKGIIWDRIDKPTMKAPNTTFHNFDNKHNYDFDEMENMLLR